MSSASGSALPPLRFTLTISGGISKGAYEAGFNWTLLHLMKKARTQQGSTPAGFPHFTSTQAALAYSQAVSDGGKPQEPKRFVPELIAASGASAGTINALLSALTWCHTPEVDAAESLDNNLLWHVWTNIDLQDLVPGTLPVLKHPRTQRLQARETAYVERYAPSLNTYFPSSSDASSRSGQLTWEGELLKKQLDGSAEGYRAADRGGLLSRNAFALAESFLIKELDPTERKRFQPGCVVPVGFTTSSPTSVDLKLGKLQGADGGALSIKTNRYSVLLQFQGPPAQAGGNAQHFEEYPAETNAQLKRFVEKRLMLETPPGKPFSHPLDTQHVIRLMHASSAFPLAFAPVPARGLVQGLDGLMMDGGILDNVPLGLAHYFVLKRALDECQTTPARSAQAASNPGSAQQTTSPPATAGAVQAASIPGSAQQTTDQSTDPGAQSACSQQTASITPAQDFARLLYVDPDRLREPYLSRLEKDGVPRADQAGISPLGAAAAYLGQSMNVGRQFELQSLQRYAWNMHPQGWDKETWSLNPDLSTRGAPITGELMFAFGAFVYEPFRQYDYFVGAHDALVNFSAELCQAQLECWGSACGDKAETEKLCMRSQYQQLRTLLLPADGKPQPSSLATYALDTLAAREGYLGRDDPDFPEELQEQEIAEVLRFLLSPRGQQSLVEAQSSFAGLVDVLKELRASLRQSLPSSQYRKVPKVVRHPENELLTVAMSLASRNAQQECELLDKVCGATRPHGPDLSAESDSGPSTLVGADVLTLAVHKVRGIYKQGLDWPEAYLGRGKLTTAVALGVLTPTSGLLDVAHGSTEWQWTGAFHGGERWIRPGLVGGALLDPNLRLDQPTWNAAKTQLGGLAGVSFRFPNPVFSRADLMFRVSQDFTGPWLARPWVLGGELGVNLVANTLRFSVLYCDGCMPAGAAPWTIRLGITDLGATTYWLVRAVLHAM